MSAVIVPASTALKAPVTVLSILAILPPKVAYQLFLHWLAVTKLTGITIDYFNPFVTAVGLGINCEYHI
ncbi:hypothetical protein, partial [Streptococcus pseudopneumoniae]|uniref:hypothetical protein n=1 Tax=Streptococcus pseudopneumoniae TaxID=257758 RepID=UPI0019D6A895